MHQQIIKVLALFLTISNTYLNIGGSSFPCIERTVLLQLCLGGTMGTTGLALACCCSCIIASNPSGVPAIVAVLTTSIKVENG